MAVERTASQAGGVARGMSAGAGNARLGVDVGGTFTDVALETGDGRWLAKVLTTPEAPEQGILAGIREALDQAALAPDEVGVIIHGFTLGANALIERRGVPTAFITTDGHRDTLEIATESRFDLYDLFIDKPEPLVPRKWRFTVRERMDASGQVLLPLDEGDVAAAAREIAAAGLSSVAVGFLHAYANPAHERRAAEILADLAPGLDVTLASEVAQELREYERFSTACANAYIRKPIAGYLTRLRAALEAAHMGCPLLLMLSNGGVTTLETAVRLPIRLVESGPAGGAIYAAHAAAECALDSVLAFDMGGTTAKICLVDQARARTARRFEIARRYRFLKGSGLPLQVPAIELVEIGAGGGSIARVDKLGRIAVGPDSAGSTPGPVCYARGGAEPTVTDADVVMGRIDPAAFAGSKVRLDAPSATAAVDAQIAKPLGLDVRQAAAGVAEIVGESMAAAARVHCVESGQDAAVRTVVAFGGAAPLHAARLAEKLHASRVVVPRDAGVGSAVGFLRAPIAFELVRSRPMSLETFDPAAANRLLEEMTAEASGVVRQAGARGRSSESRTLYMRYVGQGHELAVPVPAGPLGADAAAAIRAAYEAEYRRHYNRLLSVAIEILAWRVVVAVDPPAAPPTVFARRDCARPQPIGQVPLVDSATEMCSAASVYLRGALRPDDRIIGPAVIREANTSTVVPATFCATVHASGALVLDRIAGGAA